MKISIYIVLLLALLFSCKQEKQKASVTHSSIPKTPHVKEVQTKKNDTLDTLYIKVKDAKKIELPFGSEKVKIAKPVTDTVYSIYKNTLDTINNNISKINFKDSTNNKNTFEHLIQETKDSLNPVLYHTYYSKLKERNYYISNSVFRKNDYKIFFLKTVYYSLQKNKIENIYLVSVREDKIIDVLNIYYHSLQTHSMKSRFFYIDKNVKITSAIYTNIEGEISIRDYREFEMNKEGFFKTIN